MTPQLKHYHENKDSINDSRKKKREGWKKAGLCRQCGCKLDPSSKTMCEHHLGLYEERQRKIKEAVEYYDSHKD